MPLGPAGTSLRVLVMFFTNSLKRLQSINAEQPRVLFNWRGCLSHSEEPEVEPGSLGQHSERKGTGIRVLQMMERSPSRGQIAKLLEHFESQRLTINYSGCLPLRPLMVHSHSAICTMTQTAHLTPKVHEVYEEYRPVFRYGTAGLRRAQDSQQLAASQL